MKIRKLLIANRGEIAVRIAATAAEMSIGTVAVYSQDDQLSLHVSASDEAVALEGAGPSAYLAQDAIISAARERGCDAIHPGYGFLAESADFARACSTAGIVFIGPQAEALELLGDKTASRMLARDCMVPVLPGSDRAVSLDEARTFLQDSRSDGIMLKAVAGGGGRGMQPVLIVEELEAAWARCVAEALAAFGDGRLYVERLLEPARHIEIQVIGDGTGAVACLGERECSLQRRRQKIVESAPVENLDGAVLAQLRDNALAMARLAQLRSLATFEFLVAVRSGGYAFIEANPRLQVEHTVTEEVTGLDLVRLQLALAGGACLADLGLTNGQVVAPKGSALQLRINLEQMQPDGTVRPSAGTLSAYAPPTGRGLRVDGFGYPGYAVSARFDSLLVKLIVCVDVGGQVAAQEKAARALAQFKIGGIETNIAFLQALLSDDEVRAGTIRTTLIDDKAADLVAAAQNFLGVRKEEGEVEQSRNAALFDSPAPEGALPVSAPMIGVLVDIAVSQGQIVRKGEEVAVIEAMKMQHPVLAPASGSIMLLVAALGDTVQSGQPLAFVLPKAEVGTADAESAGAADFSSPRLDLAAVIERQLGALDAARSEAVERRHSTGRRTARENIDDLCDEGSFIEYGRLVVAGRSRRATFDELVQSSPADGLVMGMATVNAPKFGQERSRIATMAYDYTVFAGTQGARNHTKTDRLVELAERWKLPLVLFAEGGGGRPGDTDGGGFVRAFELFPKLSGTVPLIGVVAGRCFAGNAALLGCCDVIIATRDTNLGMGGPAMIEGGGLGIFKPEDIGAASVQFTNGVIDILVEHEEEAVAAAKHYLSFFQGQIAEWSCADQLALRGAIPENRLRTYDVRALIGILADTGTFRELRAGFGLAMITALARIEGRPVGIIANDPSILGGAIDSDAADKAARFMQLCEAHRLPIVSLSDTPGIMVGPEAEETALVRHAARMFVIGANLTVPIMSVILRKSYGLGAIAMTGGSYQASLFSVAWPSGEFGGMGLEGAVKLGYRKELDAISDPAERKRKFEELVARLYDHGKAMNTAAYFGIDDVIDPADTRRWIVTALRSAQERAPGTQARPHLIDPW